MSTAGARKNWAAVLISRADSPPRYGSPAWLALPDSSPAKVAAVVIAAESWARDEDELESRLRCEVEAMARLHKRAEDAQYVAQIADFADRWTGSGFRPHPDLPRELETEWREWVGGDVA